MAVAAAALAMAGCLGRDPRPVRGPGSSLWVDAGSAALRPVDQIRLREAGIVELTVPVAELTPDSSAGALRRLAGIRFEASLPVTLAIVGEWQPTHEPQELARQVAAELEGIRYDWEVRHSVVTGVHFDLGGVEPPEDYGEFLEAMRGELDRTLLLSVQIPPAWLGHEDLERIVADVDYASSYLFGQKIGAPDDAGSWDFSAARRNAETVSRLEVPFLVGVIGVGSAVKLGREGSSGEPAAELSLGDLVWNRRLELRTGSVLESGLRRVQVFAAKGATKVGEWDLAAGESVRVTRVATSDLEELIRQAGGWGLEGQRGFAFFRLPGEGERLSLTDQNFSAALDPAPATPDIGVGFSVRRRTGRGYVVELEVTNQSSEATELSYVPGNYIDVLCVGCLFGTNVKLGGFYRFELYQRRRDGKLRVARKPANLLRLYLPILEGLRRFETGSVQVLGKSVRFEVTGRFQLSDGRVLELAPIGLPRD